MSRRDGFNRGLEGELTHIHTSFMRAAATGVASGLYQELARGQRSGRAYDWYPEGVLASNEKEYPQEVTSETRNHVDVRPSDSGDIAWSYGIFGVDQEKLDNLEKGNAQLRITARRPVERASNEYIGRANRNIESVARAIRGS